MNTDSRSQHEDTTRAKAEELEALIDLARAVTRPVINAKRKQANGHEVDIDQATAETRKLFTDFISMVSPAAQTGKGPDTYTSLDLMSAYWASMEAKKASATTGLASLDKALSGGLEQDRLVVLLGAPGSGKTTLINQIVNHTADAGRPVLYVTSEDAPMTLLAKTIARRGQIEYSAVQYGWRSEQQKINMAFTAYKEQKSARLLRYMDATSGTTLAAIAETAEQHFSTHQAEATGAPILVVDYLQRLARGEGLGTDLRSSITVYTERLRALACELHCTVVVLCAMNRASGYHAGNSTIASAKESGDIDYTADVIIAIGEEVGSMDPAPGLRRWMLRIDKNRQGSVTYDSTHIALDWYASRQQFTEAAKGDDTLSEADKAAFNGNGSGKRGRR